MGIEAGSHAAVTEGVRIGTSGWHYSDWIGPFYPPQIQKRNLLTLYAKHFSTVEINASFYHVPSETAVRKWYRETPDNFLFAWKASRFITHNKKLRDAGESIAFIMGRMQGLGDKFGPVLWQLPPQLQRDRERLASFLDLLPRERRHAVEFRHRSWYEAEILEVLRERDVALCISDHASAPSPWEITAGHVYLRAHGPSGRYFGSYPEETLRAWAGAIAVARQQGRAVFCYFDNDNKAAAPFDAKRLMLLHTDRGG
jgi:uncharacterized protein YecE (DUF72 family)